MRILYDGQIFAGQAAGGINRYFANLIRRLPNDVFPTFTTAEIRTVNYPEHPNLKTHYFQRYGFRPGRLSYWLEKYYFQAIERFNHFDLAHPTYYTLLTQQDMSRCRFPIVLTVHDMIHEIFADKIDPYGEQAEQKRKAILSAQTFICVSESTKRDLLKYYNLPEEKISVVYHASEIDSSMAHGPQPVPERPYYLYVGSRISYKNFDRLLAAFAKVRSIQPDIALCVVGSPLNQTEAQRIAELGLERSIEHYGYADDHQLAKLYRCSVAFVYPSLYEGFGIPPLEAMLCGTTVVAANTSSISEVVGDAGILFDPHSTHELADILLDLLDNPAQRDRRIQKSVIQAQSFSWEQTATQTLEVYRSVSC